jgi:ribose 5-phosphate isomerase B
MRVALGFDHAGFALKAVALAAVRDAGHEALDLGTHSSAAVDFPDFAETVGREIQSGAAERGILVCGSGVGACIAANKLRGVYASVCHDVYSASQGVAHDAMNVLCLGARVLEPDLAAELIRTFLSARFVGHEPGGERFARRVAKIHALERLDPGDQPGRR